MYYGIVQVVNSSQSQSVGKSRAQDEIGFGFASRWLKNWREIVKPITKRSNRVVTFNSCLKTALIIING